MCEDMSIQAEAYTKEHLEDLSSMLATLWKLMECDNVEAEMKVFLENKECFGNADDYVSYAIEMKNICFARQYCKLLENRMNNVSASSERFLYNLLCGCLCEWAESGSRRRMTRFFLSCIPSAYMEAVWRKAGAKINNISEEEVVPEMVWKYPVEPILDSWKESAIVEETEKMQKEEPEDADKKENELEEEFIALRKALDVIHKDADEVITAYREVLDTLSAEELKLVVQRIDTNQRCWCILFAEGEKRTEILNSIEDVHTRLLCLKETVSQGENGGDYRAKKTMPMEFFIKCREVRQDTCDEEE